jgi:hypothetical protein
MQFNADWPFTLLRFRPTDTGLSVAVMSFIVCASVGQRGIKIKFIALKKGDYKE